MSGIPRPRISRPQVIRLGRLLNMYYKPSEIAEEIGISPDTVYRTYIPAGCPHEVDESGRIWIIGTTFRDWALLILAGRKNRKR